MTFCAQCKADVASAPLTKECCIASQAYGMLLFSKNFSAQGLEFASEHAFVTDRLQALLESLGIAPKVLLRRHGARDFVLEIKDPKTAERLLLDYGYTGEELSLRVLEANFLCEDCRAAFLGGCFLAGGTLADPNSGYHLEFATHRSNLLNDLGQQLAAAGFEPRRTTRNYKKVLYIKNSSQIEDFLTYIGAGASSMELMATKVLKDIKNRTNRRVNCENANIDKTVDAAANDAALIQYIFAKRGESYLGDELLAVARLRLENPDLSLTELGALLGDKLTKSGVNHRLRKIREAARVIKEEESGHSA